MAGQGYWRAYRHQARASTAAHLSSSRASAKSIALAQLDKAIFKHGNCGAELRVVLIVLGIRPRRSPASSTQFEPPRNASRVDGRLARHVCTARLSRANRASTLRAHAHVLQAQHQVPLTYQLQGSPRGRAWGICCPPARPRKTPPVWSWESTTSRLSTRRLWGRHHLPACSASRRARAPCGTPRPREVARLGVRRTSVSS